MNKNTVHFKKTRDNWSAALLGGALAQILYNVFSMQLYHYYIYFYIVGIILLVDSIIGWGKLNADGIDIRLGLGLKRTLYFQLRDIIKVEIKDIKKTSIISSGGLSKIPFINSDYVRALVLTFNKSFDHDSKAKIEEIKKNTMFKDKVDFDNQENKLFVFEKPDGGFRKVVTAIKKYSSHELKIDIKKNNNNSFGIILSKFNLMLM